MPDNPRRGYEGLGFEGLGFEDSETSLTTLEQRSIAAIKTLPLPSQSATDAENYRRFLDWLYRGSTQESVAALVIDLEFGVPTDGE